MSAACPDCGKWAPERSRHYCIAGRLSPPAPWTHERRERVGRATWEVVLDMLQTCSRSGDDTPWEELQEHHRETYRAMGEAAVRADEGAP